MAGIIAIVAEGQSGEVLEASEIESLADIYESLRGSGIRHFAEAGTRALVVKIDARAVSRPGIERNGASWAAATGVVYGSPSLLGAVPDDLEGQFTLTVYHSQEGSLTFYTDPFGLHPLYIARSRGKIYISTSALTLARHLSAPADPLGLAVFLCCGTQHGALTHWKGIERIGPATTLTFSASGFQREVYWRPVIDEAVERLGLDEAADRAIEVADATLAAMYPERREVWADITGGYDSRLLNLFLDHAGIALRTNTVGPGWSEDVRIGRQVAHAAGWKWTRFRLPPDWASEVSRYMQSAIGWSDGRLTVTNLAATQWVKEQQATALSTAITGGSGEIWRGYSWRHDLVNPGRIGNVDYEKVIDMSLVDADALALLEQRVADEVRDFLRALMIEQTKPYAGLRNTTQLDVLFLRRKPIWDGMYSASAAAFLHGELPYLTRRMITMAMSIDFRHRHGRKLMRALIGRLNPRVAPIPTTLGGPSVAPNLSNLHYYLPAYWRMGRYAVAKLSQRAVGHALFAPSTREDPRATDGRGRMVEPLMLTVGGMRVADYCDKAALGEMVRSIQERHTKPGEVVGRLATMELILNSVDAAQ